MYRLVNPIQNYAWGSRSALAGLLGRSAPTAEPEAELWMGAHRSAPSRLLRDGVERSLAEAIGDAPLELLGRDTVERFGSRLPFLLKLLAVEQPLSLQVHPDGQRARDGFAGEQAQDIALDDPRRNYRDAYHKPELICALTPFDALCGLRPVEEIDHVLAELALPQLKTAGQPLVGDPGGDGIRSLLSAILRVADPRGLVQSVRAACLPRIEKGGRFAAAYRVAVDLAERFPADPGVAVSLLLNRVSLRPGEATYLPPGRLHAYLRGVGIEVMASSDNVLRGGLTTKHVDVPELLAAAESRCGPVTVQNCEHSGSGWCTYATPTPDFALSTATLAAGKSVTAGHGGPQILLCVDGAARLTTNRTTLSLDRGQSAFIPAGETVDVSGAGTVVRTTTGPPEVDAVPSATAAMYHR